MNVLKPGTKCLIGVNIQARITEVSVKPGDHVLYNVVWWEGRSRHSEWLDRCEIEAIGITETVPIGLLSSDNH